MNAPEDNGENTETLLVLVAVCKAVRLAMETHGIDWTIGLLSAAVKALQSDTAQRHDC